MRSHATVFFVAACAQWQPAATLHLQSIRQFGRFVASPSTAASSRHSVTTMNEAEERQRLINQLREQKVDLSRQMQEANARAYRANAELQERKKKRAAERSGTQSGGSGGTPADKQRAALEAMFSLSIE